VFAALPLQVAICLGVAEDHFGLRVELQLTASARNYIRQVSTCRLDVTQPDYGVRRLAAAYAIDEIAGVGGRFVRVIKQELLAFAIENLEARFTCQAPDLNHPF